MVPGSNLDYYTCSAFTYFLKLPPSLPCDTQPNYALNEIQVPIKDFFTSLFGKKDLPTKYVVYIWSHILRG